VPELAVDPVFTRSTAFPAKFVAEVSILPVLTPTPLPADEMKIDPP
jgi:hypothetical protein